MISLRKNIVIKKVDPSSKKYEPPKLTPEQREQMNKIHDAIWEEIRAIRESESSYENIYINCRG